MDANGELTPAELALLRTHPQRTDIYLAIPTYATVYTAVVVAPTPATNDGVYQLTFDTGAGATWANVVPGMTLLVGTVAGASDIGIARIRKAITTGDAGVTGTIYIGTTSEIDFAVGQFLTITNEFGLWPRHPYVDPATGEEFMDWDIDYDTVTNPQHEYFAAVPNMLPSAVVDLAKATDYGVEFNVTNVWTPYDLLTAIAYTFNWTCTGADSITVPGFGSPATFRFTTAGTYLVKLECIITWATGETQTSYGYRYVIVYDDAHPLIKSPILESCDGDFSSGGWSYRVTCHSQANLTTIHNRTLCLLVADDWYGDTHQIQRPNRNDGSVFPLNQNYGTGIGPIIDRENIVAIGWIDGESITWSNDTGKVSFDVQGPQWWFDKMQGYPTGVDDTTGVPTGWTQINNLTAQKGLWHFLYWRTTAASVMDIPQCGRFSYDEGPDPRRLATTYTPSGSLWEQLRAIADRIFAISACNRYGQLFVNVDSQLIDPSGPAFLRGTHPNIMGAAGLTDADWRDDITIERRTVPEAGLVDLSGIYWSGTVATSLALFSLSPGHYYKHYGRPASRDRVSLLNQAQANTLAGLYMGWLNNEYPNIDVPLAANNRCFDIAPYMFSWMNIAVGDTPRGIVWPEAIDEASGKRVIPRRVSFQRDAGEAVMLTDVTFEAETFANAAMIGDPPIEPPPPPPPPTICDNPLAINYGGTAPCIFAPPLPEASEIVLLMTPHHVGRAYNFFTTDATVWDEIVPSVVSDGDGICANIALDKTTGEAYVLTRPDGTGTKAQNGIFYCSDASATVPVWTLGYSQQDYENAALAANPLAEPQLMNAMVLVDDGTLYVQAEYHNVEYGSYVHGSGILFNYVYTHVVGTDIFNLGYQFNMWAGTTAARCMQSKFNASYVYQLTGAIYAQVFVGNASSMTALHKNLANDAVANAMYSFVDGAGPAYTLEHLDVEADRPIVITDLHVFYTRHSDGALMIDAIVQALVNTAGAVTGVFSSAGAMGGAYCNVQTYGHIAWVASSPNASNDIRNIAYTEDGGVTWVTKDGNWNAVIGAYEGDDVGTVCPMICYSNLV